MRLKPAPALAVEVLVSSGLWQTAEDAKAVVRRAVARAATAVPNKGSEVAVVLADDSTIRGLNRTWRGIDKPTNVLAFPTNGGSARHLGDVVLAYETISGEARAHGKPFAHHLAHLAVHGFLHLAGYDHDRSDKAREMEGLERAILQLLAIPDPYARKRARRHTPRRKSNAGHAAKSTRRRPGSLS